MELDAIERIKYIASLPKHKRKNALNHIDNIKLHSERVKKSFNKERENRLKEKFKEIKQNVVEWTYIYENKKNNNTRLTIPIEQFNSLDPKIGKKYRVRIISI